MSPTPVPFVVFTRPFVGLLRNPHPCQNNTLNNSYKYTKVSTAEASTSADCAILTTPFIYSSVNVIRPLYILFEIYIYCLQVCVSVCVPAPLPFEQLDLLPYFMHEHRFCLWKINFQGQWSSSEKWKNLSLWAISLQCRLAIVRPGGSGTIGNLPTFLADCQKPSNNIECPMDWFWHNFRSQV